MTRLSIAGIALALVVTGAGLAEAQTPPPYPVLSPPPFEVRPALPETMPTWSRDETSGTAQHDIAATPNCGAANPQGGIPSMITGTCP
jgi:hypothetical protein